MSTETRLISETEKWLGKAEAEFAKIMASTDAKLSEASSEIKPKGKKGEEFAKNISAYLSDTKHFSEKGDYVRAFEAVIWAWAWIEIGKKIGVLLERK